MDFDDRPMIRKRLDDARKMIEDNPFNAEQVAKARTLQTTYAMILVMEDEVMEEHDMAVMRAHE